MDDAIVVIAAQMKPVFRPKTKWDLRIGIMRTDGVKDQEDQNERIRCIGEPETPISDGEHSYADEDKQILQQPIAAIEWMNCQYDPERDVARDSDRQKIAIAFLRSPQWYGLVPPGPRLYSHF